MCRSSWRATSIWPSRISTPLDPQEIAAAALGRAGGDAAGPQAPPTDDAQESAQRVWWYLLFAGLLLLGAETIVANRLTV